MEIIRLIALILALSLMLFSCAPDTSELLSYQEKSFRAHLTWQNSSVTFSAVMTSRPDIYTKTLEFTAPPSLEGITVEKCGEVVTTTLDGIEIVSPTLLRLAEITTLFSISGTMKRPALTYLSGVKMNRVEITDPSGKPYELYLYPASGLPRLIRTELSGNSIALDVISFEFIS